MAEYVTEKAASQGTVPGESLVAAKSERAAYSTACRILDAAMQSRAHLATKLGQRGFPSDVIAHTCDRLSTEHLINDEHFASALVAGFLRKGYGRYYCERALPDRGIPEDITQEVFATWDMDEEIASAKSASRRFVLDEETEPAVRKKCKDYLFRRGYSHTAIHAVVQENLW